MTWKTYISEYEKVMIYFKFLAQPSSRNLPTEESLRKEKKRPQSSNKITLKNTTRATGML